MEIVEAYKRERSTIKASLTRIHNFCSNESVKVEDIKPRVDRAEELFTRYNEIQNYIDSHVDEIHLDNEELYRADIVDKYFTIKATLVRITPEQDNDNTIVGVSQTNNELTAAMQALLQHQTVLGDVLERVASNNNAVNSSTPVQQHSTELRLPRVQIPEFDGTVLNWVRFKDLFEEIIHKSNLTNVEKLEYLQTKLVGDALSLIKHIKPTNANYELAWNILKKKFDNNDLVKQSLLDLLLDQPIMKSAAASEIKQFYTNINEAFNALKAIDDTVAQWDTIILYNLPHPTFSIAYVNAGVSFCAIKCRK